MVEMGNQKNNGKDMLWSGNMFRTNATSFISLILIFLISTDLSILLDITVFRQILGFIFLAFVPGALFLSILKPDKLGLTEKIVLSAGLSISFVMFIGILINTLYPLFGYETPLSLKSLVVSLTFALLILAFIAHLSGGFTFFFTKRTDLRLNTRDKALVVIPILSLPLSVLGMHIMNTTDNNAMLMALLFLIPVYVISISIWHYHIPENAYPTIIFLFSISLILLWGMRSSHIIGTDAHVEYMFFKQTYLNEKWQILQNSTLDSCLSVSILPTTYQSFLNVNPEYLFKILYPLLFSISPLVVYFITKNYISNTYAFLAAIFFMSQDFFIITTASARTNVAILFFALSIMVLLHSEISDLNKKVIFIVFILSCIFSHYSTTYISFIVFLITWVCMQLIYRLILYLRRSDVKKVSLKDVRNIIDFTTQSVASRFSKPYFSKGILAIFFVVLFFWYSQVTGVAFNRGIGFIAETINSMQNFFIMESRDSGISAALGQGLGEKPLLSKIIFVISWLPNIFIIIGVVTTLARYCQRVALPYENRSGSPDFLSNEIDAIFFILSLICLIILVATVAIPYVVHGYDLGRILLQMMVVLSTFLIIGGLELARFLHIKRSYLLILAVIIPYFILTTGMLQSIAGNPTTIALDSHGPSYDSFYIHEQEIEACKWLGEKNEIGKKIYADLRGKSRLISQGMIPFRYIGDLDDFLQRNKDLNGYIYLRYFNVLERNVSASPSNEFLESIQYKDRLSMEGKIYENGGSVIFEGRAVSRL